MLKVFRLNPTSQTGLQGAIALIDVQSRPYARRIISRSLEITAAAVDLLGFLRAAPPNSQRVYWENRQSDLALAGFGVAAELYAEDEQRFTVIQQQLAALFADAQIESPHADAHPRLFGGFAFQPDHTPQGVWAAFPSAYFVLPRVQLTRKGGRTWLTVNAFAESERDESAINAELMQIAEQIKSGLKIIGSPSAPRNAVISYPLEREQWRTEIERATAQMRAGELDKVVLSRSSDVSFASSIDPLAALSKLQERYPDTYRFLIEPQAGSAFFGATPELLIALHERHLKTAALAGSIRRGATPHEDDQLAAQLFHSLKDRYEHHLVVVALEDLLMPITHKLDVPEAPHILKLSNIQHLSTPISGELSRDTHVLDVVEKLHPTPALGGYPRQIAIQTIRDSEPVARGWYAAPVGWIDADGNGTFAVAIRSAVTQENCARLYAGAGIVSESDPDKEWDETQLKFRPMLDALGAL